MSRPKLPDGAKVIYQRIAIEYKTYRRFLEIAKKIKEIEPKMTNTQILDTALDFLEADLDK